jgi:hypothetical protein
MRYIQPYANDSIFESNNLDKYFPGLPTLLYRASDVNLILEEGRRLNQMESVIPKDILFEAELNMLLHEGSAAVTNYHKNLAIGKNILVESLTNSIPKEIKEAFNKLQSEFKKLNKKQVNKIFEEAEAALTASGMNIPTEFKEQNAKLNVSGMNIPTDADDVSAEFGKDFQDVMKGIDSNHDFAARVKPGDSSILSILKKLWNALTEDGRAIGVFQFILDIVGLVGSFFEPIGMVADAINAIIYMIRGKWMLALICVIAAIIPLGGDLIKGFFKAGAKTAKPVMDVGTIYFSTTGKAAAGTATVSKEAVELAAKASPDSIKALNYIGASTGPAVTGFMKYVKGFFDKFLASVVGWIPLIGKPLRAFFEGIGNIISQFAGKATNFANDVPKITAQAQAKVLDDFFAATAVQGAEITAKGDKLIVKNANGIVELPGNVLKHSDMLAGRYGNQLSSKILKQVDNNVVAFYTSMSNVIGKTSSQYGALQRFGKGAVNGFVFTKKIPLFIGKQVLKWISGDPTQNYTDNESTAWGIAAMSDMARQRRDRNLKENPDAFYDVPVFDGIEDDEFTKVSTKVINDYAQKFNLPSIGMVGYYARREKDKLPEDVENFYNACYADRVGSGMLKDMEKFRDDTGIFESKQPIRMKYIKPFSF